MPQNSFVQLARRPGSQVQNFLEHTNDALTPVEAALDALCKTPGVNLEAEFKTENAPTSLRKLREDTPRIRTILEGLAEGDSSLVDRMLSQVHQLHNYAFQLQAAAENNDHLEPAQALDHHATHLQTCLLAIQAMLEAYDVGRQDGIRQGKSPRSR
jgi:hypothetical protein